MEEQSSRVESRVFLVVVDESPEMPNALRYACRRAKRTGLMLNGHLRQQIAAERGEKIPVLYVDLDPREEKLILASLDPIGEMAVLDEGQLAALLAELDLPSDGEIAQLLNSLLEETIEETPKDSGSSAAVPNDRTPRQLGDRKTQIKPVLYVNQVAVFEQALRMTHESNRGKAIMAVCDFYIRANS